MKYGTPRKASKSFKKQIDEKYYGIMDETNQLTTRKECKLEKW